MRSVRSQGTKQSLCINDRQHPFARDRASRQILVVGFTVVAVLDSKSCLPGRRDILRIAAIGAAGASLPRALAAQTSKPAEEEASIDIYPSALSFQAGDQVPLHISSTAKRFSIEVAREGSKREVLTRIEDITGVKHDVPANASTHGCGWPVSVAVPLPRHAKSGYYSISARSTSSESRDASGVAFFVVRSRQPGKDTNILLQLTTNTYNAYNDWGGSSLYVGGPHPLQGTRVSFERPIARGFLTKPNANLSDWHPYAGWHNWERAFVAWAEGAGYKLDFAVNSDLEFHPEILANYRLVLSVGHDEYWSAPMRDAVENFIGQGGNVAFFSGNTAYWQVRSEQDGKALVCYKYDFKRDPVYEADDKRLLASLWSHRLVGRPENQMTGVSFNRGGYHRFGSVPKGAGGYTVYRPDHWMFEGTDLKWGDVFGSEDKIVGYECDGCDHVWENGLPVPTCKDGTPEGFQIAAMAPAALWETDLKFTAECLFGDSSETSIERVRRGAAILGSYTRGGTVVTTGCTEWSRGLETRNPLVERITRNVLDWLSV